MEFIIHWIMESFAATFYMTTFSAYSSCFIGLCTYLGALIDDFKGLSVKLNKKIISDNVNHSETREILAELVQLHSNTLR